MKRPCHEGWQSFRQQLPGVLPDDGRPEDTVLAGRRDDLDEALGIAVGDGDYIGVLALTDRGREVAETLDSADSKQRYYDGFVKPTGERRVSAAGGAPATVYRAGPGAVLVPPLTR